MSIHTLSRRWAPRAGLILGPLAWAINQQFTSTMIYAQCARGRTTTVLVSGALCACLAMLGIAFSWSARRYAPAENTSAGQHSTAAFIATLSTCAAAIFLLVIIAGTAAGFLLPGCYR